MRRLLSSLFIFTAIVLQGCGQKLEPENSCNFVQNSQLQRVSWKGQLPINLYIHESVPKAYYAPLFRAMSRWEYSLGKPLFRVMGIKSGPVAPARDGESVIYWYKTWSDERKTEQARTTIYWVGDRIEEADMYINNKDFPDFYEGVQSAVSAKTCESEPDSEDCAVRVTSVDFESLMVHELGHVLGLQHNEAEKSVMAPSLASGLSRRVPETADMNSVRCEYE